MAPSRAILSTAPSQAARASSELRWGFNSKSKSTKKCHKKSIKKCQKSAKKVFKGNSSLTGSQSLCPQLTWLRFWEWFFESFSISNSVSHRGELPIWEVSAKLPIWTCFAADGERKEKPAPRRSSFLIWCVLLVPINVLLVELPLKKIS